MGLGCGIIVFRCWHSKVLGLEFRGLVDSAIGNIILPKIATNLNLETPNQPIFFAYAPNLQTLGKYEDVLHRLRSVGSSGVWVTVY